MWTGRNASVRNGVAEGGLRYGDLTQRTGYVNTDTGRGMCYAEFATDKEFLAVVKDVSSGKNRLYTVNPATGVYTAVTRTSPPTGEDPADIPDGQIVFTVFKNRVYAAVLGTSKLFVRTIGGGSADSEKWAAFKPEFRIAASASVSTSRPDYVDVSPQSSDTTHYLGRVGYPDFPDPYSTPDAYGIRFGTTFVRTNGGYLDGVFDCVMASSVDLSDVDFLFFTIYKDESNGQPVSFDSLDFYISEDAATPLTYTWLQTQTEFKWQDKVTMEETAAAYYVRVDMRGVPNASKNAVRRYGFRLVVWRSAGVTVMTHIRDFKAAGAEVRPLNDTPSDIEYAYAYAKSGDGTLSVATRATLAAADTQGTSPSPGLAKGGVWVLVEPSVDAALAALGFDTIRIYRRDRGVTSTGTPKTGPTDSDPTGPGTGTGQWRWINPSTTINNSATPSFTDKIRESALKDYTAVDLSFGDSQIANLTCEALGYWKGHLVIGADRQVFFSYVNAPNIFLPSVELLSFRPDAGEDPESIGRTLYMSQNRSEKVYGFAASDAFYGVSNRTVQAMIGDQAPTATPFREMPGTYGTTSPLGVCPWMGGTLVASQTGLWFYKASRAFAVDTEDTTVRQELTKDVRRSWATLWGSDGTKCVVVPHDDEVWVFNGTKMMRLSKELEDGLRQWEEGDFPNIVAAASSPSNGLRVLLSDGRSALVGRNQALAEYSTDNGSAATFAVESGKMHTGRLRLADIEVIYEGTPNIVLYVDDGVKGAFPQQFTEIDGTYRLPQVDLQPGFVFWFRLEGVVGRDRIIKTVLIFEYAGDGDGN